MSTIAVITMNIGLYPIYDTINPRQLKDAKKSLDKDLNNFKSGAWKTFNHIWYEPLNGKIIHKEYLGNLKIKIAVNITKKVRDNIVHYKTGNINNDLKMAIRKYINENGPDTWMGGDITYKKDFEIIPKLLMLY